jgi:acyl-CoA synthetase (AMP-forming)/AMP-acid ligase II
MCAMQVAQLPASQEKGGDRPARRALCSSVSPGNFATCAQSLLTWQNATRRRGGGPVTPSAAYSVAFQLPNWVEAAVVFWAASLLGAVVVPVVHFYGRKELGYILNSVKPKVFVAAAKFGRLEYQADLVADAGAPIVGVVGRTSRTCWPTTRSRTSRRPSAPRARDSRCASPPTARPSWSAKQGQDAEDVTAEELIDWAKAQDGGLQSAKIRRIPPRPAAERRRKSHEGSA